MRKGQSLLLFLYSNRNIVGSSLAILGLILFFTGIINAFWYLIVPGLYLIGVLVTPSSPTYELTLRNQLTADEIRQGLEDLVRSIRKQVAPEVLEKVESIKNSILDILPHIVDINSADHNIYAIRQTALDYLPETLEHYLNLPKAYANLHPVKDGQTAKQILLEQLEILDREMKEVAVDFHQNNTQQLLAHGRFLADKFHRGDVLGA